MQLAGDDGTLARDAPPWSGSRGRRRRGGAAWPSASACTVRRCTMRPIHTVKPTKTQVDDHVRRVVPDACAGRAACRRRRSASSHGHGLARPRRETEHDREPREAGAEGAGLRRLNRAEDEDTDHRSGRDLGPRPRPRPPPPAERPPRRAGSTVGAGCSSENNASVTASSSRTAARTTRSESAEVRAAWSSPSRYSPADRGSEGSGRGRDPRMTSSRPEVDATTWPSRARWSHRSPPRKGTVMKPTNAPGTAGLVLTLALALSATAVPGAADAARRRWEPGGQPATDRVPALGGRTCRSGSTASPDPRTGFRPGNTVFNVHFAPARGHAAVQLLRLRQGYTFEEFRADLAERAISARSVASTARPSSTAACQPPARLPVTSVSDSEPATTGSSTSTPRGGSPCESRVPRSTGRCHERPARSTW